MGEATRKTGGGVGRSGFVDLKVMPSSAHTPMSNQSPLSDG